jgi:hypothetical protein
VTGILGGLVSSTAVAVGLLTRPGAAGPRREEKIMGKGVCHALFAYDVGASINLDEAERRISASKQRSRIEHKRRAPQYFDYRPAPLRITQEAEPLVIGAYRSSATVDLVLYDFGAVSVAYTFPFESSFIELLGLSDALYDNPVLLTDSRRRVDLILGAVVAAVEKPSIADFVEDYVIFQLEANAPSAHGDAFRALQSQEIAQILRSERVPLSAQEVEDAMACRISFSAEDAAILDWNAALIFGREMDDVRAVLEFANVELLEMRYLDQQLDDALDQAYEALSRRQAGRFRWPGSFEADARHIAQLQVDSAILFERVTNALKLLGDQYLARVYRLVSQRFHLAAWDSSIIRKLQTLDSIYGKMADRAATRRMEALEWIIILLIAISIAVSLVPG